MSIAADSDVTGWYWASPARKLGLSETPVWCAWLRLEVEVVPTKDFLGTPGSDRIRGTSSPDYFDVSQGGNDAISGNGGDDTIYFGTKFTSQDRFNGNSGKDIVILEGDYSDGLEISEKSLHSIDSLELHGGSYVITGTLGYKGNIGEALIDGSHLEAGQTLDLRVSSVSTLRAVGGGGDDVLRAATNGTNSWLDGYTGDDVLIGGDGVNRLYGNVGADRIVMVGEGDIAMYGNTLESTRGSVDRIDNFVESGGRIEFFFDSDTTKPLTQHDFHLGKTAERVGDILFAYDAAHDRTVVKVFTDHDNKADMILHLTGDVPLTPADFIFG